MPVNSASGNRLISARVAGRTSYSYAPADGLAELSSLPAGGVGTTLQLPSNPSSGDWYAWADEDGSCGAAAPIVLQAAAGDTVSGGASLTINVPRSAGVAIFDADSDNWAVFSSLSPAGSGSEFIVLPFNYQTASPMVVSPLAPGSSVLDAKVAISTPFNGAGASLALGPASSPDEVFTPGDVAVTLAGTYENPAVFLTAAADTLELTIVPGAGATAGAGVVVAVVKL